MVLENRYIVILDLKTQAETNATYKQGSQKTSVLEIHLLDDGVIKDLTDLSIVFKFLMSDRSTTKQDATTGVSIIDATNGICQCILEPGTLSVPGIVGVEVVFTQGESTLPIPTFDFTVSNSINFLSIGYITAIETSIAGWQNEFNINEANRINTFNTNESARAAVFLAIQGDLNALKIPSGVIDGGDYGDPIDSEIIYDGGDY